MNLQSVVRSWWEVPQDEAESVGVGDHLDAHVERVEHRMEGLLTSMVRGECPGIQYLVMLTREDPDRETAGKGPSSP